MGVIAAVLIGVALLTGFAVVLAMTEAPMSDEPVDRADPGYAVDSAANRPLTADDVGRMRFRIGLRGYRMDDVDAALDRIRHDLAVAERAGAKPVGAEPES